MNARSLKYIEELKLFSKELPLQTLYIVNKALERYLQEEEGKK